MSKRIAAVRRGRLGISVARRHRCRSRSDKAGATAAVEAGVTCGEPGVFRDLVSIDTTIAHAARIYDYLLGGETNFKVDKAAEYATADMPGGLGQPEPTSGQAVTSSAAPCGGWR